MEVCSGDTCRTNYLQSIVPPEVLTSILKYLHSSDRLRLRLTCRRLYEVVSNPRSWCVASFDHDHFTNSKVLDTILKLCAPGTKRLDVNTRGLMPRFPWVRFLKHLTRISSNLSHLSLVGVEVSTKQFDMIVNTCSALTHLKVEYFSKKRFCFPEPGGGHSTLECFELYVDSLRSSLNKSDIKPMLENWICNRCYPNHFIISFAGIDIDCFFLYFVYSLCDIQVPPGVEGKFSIRNGFEMVIKNRKVCLLVTSCSAISSLPIALVQSLTKVCGVINDGYSSSHSPDKCFEVPFSDVGHTITHIFIVISFISSDRVREFRVSLNEIAYNCPNLKHLCIKDFPKGSKDLSGLESISKECVKLEGLELCGYTSSDTINRKTFLNILFRIRNLSFLSIALSDLPLDCDLQQKKLERLHHLEVFVDDNATNEQLTALGQLVSTCLKRLWIKSYSDSSLDNGLRNLLFSLPNLQCLSLNCNSRIMDIPSNSVCYQSIEKVQLKVPELVIGKAFIDSLVKSGRLSHCYITAYHISMDALNQLIHSPRLLVCHLRLRSLSKMTASHKKEFVRKISDSATNLRQFSLKGKQRRCDAGLNVHPDLRPTFTD